MRIWSAVAIAVVGVALLAGCGATSDPAGEAVPEACGADERDEGGPVTPDARLTAEETERAKAQGKLYGEDPDLNVMVVETIMQEYGISADEAMQRNEIQFRAHDVERRARKAAGKYWGGAWFDPDNGGRFTVGVARGGDAAAVEAVFAKRDLSDATAVVVVDSTEAELEAAQEVVSDAVFPRAGDTFAEVSQDTSGNCIVARVSDRLSDETVAAMRDEVAGLDVAVLIDVFEDAPGAEPDQSGVVSEIDADRRILVSTSGEECGTWLTELDFTEVLRKSGETASWSDLTVDTPVEVWFNGPMLASCPGQTGAAKVVIAE